MSHKPPRKITVSMQQEDIAKNLAHIVNSMEAIRVEALRNFRACDDAKLEYLRLAFELASCMQAVVTAHQLQDYVTRVQGFIGDDLLLYFDPMHQRFWDELEPDFSKSIIDLTVVVLQDDYVSQGHAHHVFQALKYLIAPLEKKEAVYAGIQPFNNLLSQELISKPEVAQYVMKNLFLDYVEQSPEGYGMALQGARLDTPEFVERLAQIGALFVDLPYEAFGRMRRVFPHTTITGYGPNRKARVLFTPQLTRSAQNRFDFFTDYATKDLGDAKACMTGRVKNVYAFGKAFLQVMQKDMGIAPAAPPFPKNRRLKKPSRIGKDKNAYIISDIILYGPNETCHTAYQEIRLDGSGAGQQKNTVQNTQDGWLDHYSGGHKKMLALPILYAVLEAAHDNENQDAAKELLVCLQSGLQHNWLIMSTRFNYGRNKVWHNVNTPEQIEFDTHIPAYEGYLNDIVKQPDWETPLKSMFMTTDLEKIPWVLGVFENKRGHLWTPENNRNEDRAACAGFANDFFSIYGFPMLNTSGRSRGVSIPGL